MKIAAKKCCTNSATVWAESVAQWAQQLPHGFARKPYSVTLDFSVSSDACRLFDVLVLKNYKSGFRTNLVEVSTRELAALFKKNASTISRWLKQLQNASHVEKLSRRGTRSVYRLTSPVFSGATRVETAPNVAVDIATTGDLGAVRDKKRLCPKCKEPARITSSSGVCDGCLSEWVNRKKAQPA